MRLQTFPLINLSASRSQYLARRIHYNALTYSKMKFSMLAVAATAFAAGVNGFSAAPRASFGIRQVSY